MSIEQFANNAQTSINQNGGIAAGDTSVTVAANTGFPTNASFRLVIDSEKVLVTAGQGGLTWTITRGIENTFPAAHANGAIITQAVTNAGLLNAFVTKIDEAVMAGTTGSITFPNLVSIIPTSGRHLEIIFEARGDTAALGTVLQMQLGTGGGAVDTGANYDDELFYGTGNATANESESLAGTSGRVGSLVAASGTANNAGSGRILLPNYVGTTHKKTWSCTAQRSDNESTGTQLSVVIAGKWRNTGSITSIKLFPAAGSFAAGVFSLYMWP